ncbi:hypothetical protein [Lentzea aerocolonigenes]|uniref:hypothetical protein n=1 Tax=Lentzea aerocolonigenes TaxID=68170 RepID=UPI000AB7A41F|nr:hypothetical protein [Lentzea aerocolonigenes]MCP2250113.1 hypothetical protein [Lentzea aerocolonigenes]
MVGTHYGFGDGLGKVQVEDRVRSVEDRLDALLAESVEHELTVQEIAVAPRSKLRVACE